MDRQVKTSQEIAREIVDTRDRLLNVRLSMTVYTMFVQDIAQAIQRERDERLSPELATGLRGTIRQLTDEIDELRKHNNELGEKLHIAETDAKTWRKRFDEISNDDTSLRDKVHRFNRERHELRKENVALSCESEKWAKEFNNSVGIVSKLETKVERLRQDNYRIIWGVCEQLELGTGGCPDSLVIDHVKGLRSEVERLNEIAHQRTATPSEHERETNRIRIDSFKKKVAELRSLLKTAVKYIENYRNWVDGDRKRMLALLKAELGK